jgi:hypothetical protein
VAHFEFRCTQRTSINCRDRMFQTVRATEPRPKRGFFLLSAVETKGPRRRLWRLDEALAAPSDCSGINGGCRYYNRALSGQSKKGSPGVDEMPGLQVKRVGKTSLPHGSYEAVRRILKTLLIRRLRSDGLYFAPAVAARPDATWLRARRERHGVSVIAPPQRCSIAQLRVAHSSAAIRSPR